MLHWDAGLERHDVSEERDAFIPNASTIFTPLYHEEGGTDNSETPAPTHSVLYHDAWIVVTDVETELLFLQDTFH